MPEIGRELLREYPDPPERDEALAQECQNIGIVIAQIWKLNVDRLHEKSPSSRTRFQVHVGRSRWITVDVTVYNNDSPKHDALVKSFTIRMGESEAISPREWIINELYDKQHGVRYQPFFHDYKRARAEIGEREGFVPPEYETVDDPDLGDLRQTLTDLGICLEELRRGRKNQQQLAEFSFTRLTQENDN